MKKVLIFIIFLGFISEVNAQDKSYRVQVHSYWDDIYQGRWSVTYHESSCCNYFEEDGSDLKIMLNREIVVLKEKEQKVSSFILVQRLWDGLYIVGPDSYKYQVAQLMYEYTSTGVIFWYQVYGDLFSEKVLEDLKSATYENSENGVKVTNFQEGIMKLEKTEEYNIQQDFELLDIKG